MDAAEFLIHIWRNHRGKIIGVALGLIFALFVISFGFFKSLFICLCIAVGLFIGKMIDSKIGIKKSVGDIYRD